MAKKFKNYQDCYRYLMNLRHKLQEELKDNSMMAMWRTLETILFDTEDVITCMEENADEYIFTDSFSEYREAISGYFGEEPEVDEEFVAMAYAYKTLEDCERNVRDIVIMVADV